MTTIASVDAPALAARLRLGVTRLARRLRQEAEAGVTPSMLSALSSAERQGSLTMRETGVSNGTTGQPSSGAVTAYQQIVSGTGDFADATGYFFVSGRRVSGVVVTQISGEICLP